MLLLQPALAEGSQYNELVNEFGLGFELMDFAYPNNLEDKQIVNQVTSAYDVTKFKSIHGVFIDINYSGGDVKIQEVSILRMKQCIELAKRCGIHHVVFHSCFHPILLPEDPLYEEWSIEAAKVLDGLVEEYDISIYIENALDAGPHILYNLMQHIHSDRIKVCLDVGHAHISSTQLEEWLRVLSSYIGYFHLTDNHGIYDEHRALGTGTVQLSLIEQWVKNHPKLYFFTLEVKGIDQVKKSLAYIQKRMPEVWMNGR